VFKINFNKTVCIPFLFLKSSLLKFDFYPTLPKKLVKKQLCAAITNYYTGGTDKWFYTSELVKSGQYGFRIRQHAHLVIYGFTATPFQTASGHTTGRTAGSVIWPIWNTKICRVRGNDAYDIIIYIFLLYVNKSIVMLQINYVYNR